MSEKDTEKDKLQNNNSQKESHTKTNILLFNFSNIKQSAKIIVSDYNLFNYDFSIKSLLELNPKIEQINPNEENHIKENPNLNLIKNLNIELPSSEKLTQENFATNFINNYDTSFANFCEIDKKIFTKAFVNKRYVPFLDKFGNIKISVKNLCDILKHYSPSLKLKIKRRFIKKYKRKKLFRTLKSKSIKNSDYETISGYNNSSYHNLNNDGLKKISLRKNLKISVKKNTNANNTNNNNITDKENNDEGNINSNNNLFGNINILSNDCILSNNLLKSSILNFQPPSNNIIQGNENFFNFSLNDQNIFNFNGVTNNLNNQLINKKKTFTPYTPFNHYINNNTPNINNNPNITQSNKKINNNNTNNQMNFNLSSSLMNYNSLLSPQLISPLKDFFTPTSIHLSPNDLASPYINMPSDKFTFNNGNAFIFNSMNNIGNQNQNFINGNNKNINITYGNINNFSSNKYDINNNNNPNSNQNNSFIIMSPNIQSSFYKK